MELPDGITARLQGDSIYNDSILILEFTARKPFRIDVDGPVLDLRHGTPMSDNISAVEKDGVFTVSMEIRGWARERHVRSAEDRPEVTYGMRFFPFVSSVITGHFRTFDLPLSTLILDLPEDYRVIWFGAIVADSIPERARLSHGYGPQRSKYIFSWPKPQSTIGYYRIEIPVRLGGVTLLKLTYFQIYYWLLALLILAIASFAQVTVLLAAIAAAWTFMLQELTKANVPQRSTLLTFVYQCAGATLLIWGISWELCGWWTLILAIPLIGIAWYVHTAISNFHQKGVLPQRIAELWRWRILMTIERQRVNRPPIEAAASARSLPQDSDTQGTSQTGEAKS